MIILCLGVTCTTPDIEKHADLFARGPKVPTPKRGLEQVPEEEQDVQVYVGVVGANR